MVVLSADLVSDDNRLFLLTGLDGVLVDAFKEVTQNHCVW